MRIALTLDRDADASESNDYLRSLLEAGVPRESIEIVTPLSRRRPRPSTRSSSGAARTSTPRGTGRTRLENGTVEVDAERDRIDFELFEQARRRGAPVLGICRGLQVVNVALGGTLVQDIPTERPSDVVHERRSATRRAGTTRSRSRREPGSRSSPAAREVLVNSRHHQAIEAVAPGLAVSGTVARRPGRGGGGATGDRGSSRSSGIRRTSPGGDPVSRRLFAEFVRAARERAARR